MQEEGKCFCSQEALYSSSLIGSAEDDILPVACHVPVNAASTKPIGQGNNKTLTALIDSNATSNLAIKPVIRPASSLGCNATKGSTQLKDYEDKCCLGTLDTEKDASS